MLHKDVWAEWNFDKYYGWLIQLLRNGQEAMRDSREASDCVITNFEFLFSHYSTLFDYKLGLLNHFLSVFCLFLPLFATLNQIF